MRISETIVLVAFHVLAIVLYYWWLPSPVDTWALIKIDVLLWLTYCCGFGLCKWNIEDF
jgi:hypothetical protein